jgi:predicted enzyme related to lactoylglutathione lyase
MAEPTRTPGIVVWRELMTQDSQRARGFYGELFGWTYDVFPMGAHEYVMFKRGDVRVAGMMQMEPGAPYPPNWTSYVSTASVDDSIEKVKKAGGSLTYGPTDVPGMGRFALLVDTDGAPFAVWQAAEGDTPQSAMPAAGEFCWETIAAKNPDAAKKFYGAVFGWTVVAGPGGGIDVFAAGDKQVADLQPAREMPPCWMTYVVVENLPNAVKRVEQLGGNVIEPSIPVPGVGNIGLITDPGGALLGLFEPPKQ